jgi:hypothetical protein
MKLRGYVDKSPVLLRSNKDTCPEVFVDSPAVQLSILSNKYKTLLPGRIPLPKNAQELWAQHKYSVMARDISSYESIGKCVATKKGSRLVNDVAQELIILLRTRPDNKLVGNALSHMWGYVSCYVTTPCDKIGVMPNKKLLMMMQKIAISKNVKYLINSTALSGLGGW